MSAAWGGLARRLGPLLAAACAAAGSSVPAAAQRPAELAGRIVEATGAPVEGAQLELVEAGARAVSDASGHYRFRAASAGRYTLRVSRVGYLERVLAVELEAGRTRWLEIPLAPAPVELPGIEAAVARAPAPGVRLGRDAIERSGACTAGDVVARVPGVVVRSTGPGGAQTVSIRGSGADAVLVLVDGVVLNDPVTGEADLSTIAASTIESVTVLTGARSARYGPRAEAGVILIETRRADADRVLEASVGSLVSRSAAVAWGGREPIAWGAGIAWTASRGAFDFRLPDEVGGGERRRENADARALDAWLAGSMPFAGGTLRLRGAAAAAGRGLPGPGYAPSRHARQEVDRVQASAGWRRAEGTRAFHITLAGARHETRFRDPAPPSGLPYDDSAAVLSLELRAEAERRRAGPTGLAYGTGAELRWQRIRTGLLDDAAPPERLDAGAFAHAALAAPVAGGIVATLGVQLRADRDPQASTWRVNRSLSLSLGSASGRWQAHIANRSSYSPPSLGDQYFRDAVGVEPNPELGAERVPSELEAGVRATVELGGVRGALGVTAYHGDVRGMIVWAPDYRFIWSPRNVDVKRRGVEAHAELEAFAGRLRLGFTGAYARVTYDRPGPDDDVQVIYRPRHTAAITAAWEPGAWRLDVDARYTGVRYPVPARVNALPAFWTVSAGVSTRRRLGGWLLAPSLRVDRLFDEHASLIFGFPEPGRVWRFAVALRPADGLTP